MTLYFVYIELDIISSLSLLLGAADQCFCTSFEVSLLHPPPFFSQSTPIKYLTFPALHSSYTLLAPLPHPSSLFLSLPLSLKTPHCSSQHTNLFSFLVHIILAVSLLGAAPYSWSSLSWSFYPCFLKFFLCLSDHISAIS